MIRYTHNYRVRYNETDFLGRLSIPALGDCLLDVAGLHALDISTGIDTLQQQGLTWVIAGMKFKLGTMPTINSRFDVATCVPVCTRITTQRDFVASVGGVTFAEVSSEWLIINMSTRRPVFINEVLPQLENACGDGTPLDRYKHLRHSSVGEEFVMNRTIGYSDVDVNRHLYSMRYLQMALDTFDTNFMTHNRICEIDVNFVSEVFWGQSVEIIRRSSDNIHNIEMQHNGKVVFRAEFVSTQLE